MCDGRSWGGAELKKDVTEFCVVRVAAELTCALFLRIVRAEVPVYRQRFQADRYYRIGVIRSDRYYRTLQILQSASPCRVCEFHYMCDAH